MCFIMLTLNTNRGLVASPGPHLNRHLIEASFQVASFQDIARDIQIKANKKKKV